jgi:hypothetical protein
METTQLPTLTSPQNRKKLKQLLPIELLRLIFEFDRSYREIFTESLKIIRIFKSKLTLFLFYEVYSNPKWYCKFLI